MPKIDNHLDPFIKPQGKKFNKPASLGIPKIKVNLLCPACSVFDKNGNVIEAHYKEHESAKTCKRCHDEGK